MDLLGGIPCKHILNVARFAKKRIPLACFHQRFYTSSVHLVQCGKVPTHLSSLPLQDGVVMRPQAGESDDSLGKSDKEQSVSESGLCSIQVKAFEHDGVTKEVMSEHENHLLRAVLMEKLGECSGGVIVNTLADIQNMAAQHLAGQPLEVIEKVCKTLKEQMSSLVQAAAPKPANHLGHAPYPRQK